MKILVAYSSRYGATAGIAERVAEVLCGAGHLARVEPIRSDPELSTYQATVIGSALYFGRWLPEATEYVLRHQAVLSLRPCWLFSSGPLGNLAAEGDGEERLRSASPRQLAELMVATRARDHQVFFGALDPSRLWLRHRLIRALPSGCSLLPEGDFRDFASVERWARGIARALEPLVAEAPLELPSA
jgi:menaquinone-dependent protoporphyrinogen oxidase